MEPLRTTMNTEQGIEINVTQAHCDQPVAVHCSQITPRGVVLHCTPEQVQAIHTMSDDQDYQVKYESKVLLIRLRFADGDNVELSSEAQIQSIRRVSQKEFQVEMCFQNMAQDGYRQISRYIGQDQAQRA